MHPTADTRQNINNCLTYTVEMGGGEKMVKIDSSKFSMFVLNCAVGLADILHNGVIVQKLNECYYNYPLCKHSFG